MKLKILNTKSHKILTTRYKQQHSNFLRSIKKANTIDNIEGDVLKNEIIFSFHDAGFRLRERAKHPRLLKHLSLCYGITLFSTLH